MTNNNTMSTVATIATTKELKYNFSSYTEDGETLTKVTTVVPYAFYKKACEDFTTVESYNASTKCAVIRVPANMLEKLDEEWAADQEAYWAHHPVRGQVYMAMPLSKPEVKAVVKPMPKAAETMYKWFTKTNEKSVAACIGTRYGMRWKVTVKALDEQGKLVTMCQWFDKQDEDKAAQLCADFDALFEKATFNFVKQTEWNGQLNGEFNILPF